MSDVAARLGMLHARFYLREREHALDDDRLVEWSDHEIDSASLLAEEDVEPMTRSARLLAVSVARTVDAALQRHKIPPAWFRNLRELEEIERIAEAHIQGLTDDREMSEDLALLNLATTT